MRNNTALNWILFYNDNGLTVCGNIISNVYFDPSNTALIENYNIFNRGSIGRSKGAETIFYYPEQPATDNWDNPAFRNIFADFNSANFYPASGSLAIGHGDPANYPKTDILGNPRDSHPDAGCYEYGSSAPSNATGDINNDGSIDAIDLQLLINMILAGNYDSKADLNSDSSIDAVDLQRLVNIILG